MGQQGSRPAQTNYDFDIGEYRLVRQLADYSLWKNIADPFTQPLVEQHKGMLQSEVELEHQQEVFEFRRNIFNVVNGLQLNYQRVDEMCGRYYNRSLFVEKIYLRLSDLTNLSLEDSLHMMIASLAGFKKLYEKFGFFRVTEKMIGINVRCMVKVWISENYAMSKPDYPVSSIRGESMEKNMASIIVGLIWNYTDRMAATRLAQTPMQYIAAAYQRHPRKNEYGFKLASYSLFEYATRHRIKCSLDMSSAAKLIEQLKDPIKATTTSATQQFLNANQGLLQISKSVDAKNNQRTIGAVRGRHDSRIPSPLTHRGPHKPTQSPTPPKLNISSDKSLNEQAFTLRSSQQRIPSRIPGGTQMSTQTVNSPDKHGKISFRPPCTRPRIISSRKTNFQSLDPNFETSLSNNLKGDSNFLPTASDCLTQRSPLGSHNSINQGQIQSSKRILGARQNENSLGLARIISPRKYEFFKEVKPPANPLQFRQNPAIKFNKPASDRILASLNEQPKPCHVIEETLDSPIKRVQEQHFKENPNDSICDLLKRLDEAESELSRRNN